LAANSFARCLEANFHDPKLYVLYGSTLERLRELDKAEKILLSGIDRFPDNPEVKIALAFIYIGNGIKKDEARNLLVQAENNALDDQQKALIQELKKHL
ncbi:MAG: tetratricopeptide repeat protein, partial [Chlorobi bacterium]|nr:tetratricopeptide repeat protein [Chlorobiota bacterium]